MDETAFRDAYKGFNPNKCVYEKSILTQHCACENSQHINLAERQGIGCTNLKALEDCTLFLNKLRSKANFTLKLSHIVGNLLPHSKEVKVQKGGLMSFFPELENKTETPLENIYTIIQKAKHFSNNDLSLFDFEQCLPSVGQFEIRKRIRRSKKT